MGNAQGDYKPVATDEASPPPPTTSLPGPMGTVIRLFGGGGAPSAKPAAGKGGGMTEAEREAYKARLGEMLTGLHVRQRELTAKSKEYVQLGREQRDEGHVALSRKTAAIVHKCVEVRTTIMDRIGQLEDLSMRLVLGDVTVDTVGIMRAIAKDAQSKMAQLGGVGAMEAALEEFRDVMDSLNMQVERIDEVMEEGDPTDGLPLTNTQLDALLNDLPPSPAAAPPPRQKQPPARAAAASAGKKVAALSV